MILMYVNCFFLSQAQGASQSRNLIDFLLNEAFSNYVVFLFGIIFGVIGWLIVRLLSRQRPQIIKAIRKEQVSLLKIDSQVEKDIKLEYKGNPINSLHRTSLDLFNKGEETVKDFTLTIQTDTNDIQNEILEKQLVDSNETEVPNSNFSFSDKSIQVNIKFLNPFRLYQDRLRLYIFSSNSIKIKDVRGRGPGWRVAYFDQVENDSRLVDALYEASGGGILSFISGLTKSLTLVVRRFT